MNVCPFRSCAIFLEEYSILPLKYMILPLIAKNLVKYFFFISRKIQLNLWIYPTEKYLTTSEDLKLVALPINFGYSKSVSNWLPATVSKYYAF